jgi:ribose/xylose/arabinose/galactoside ABC-type transport system permease subunit
VVITGYVGQIWVVQLALAGASGFTVSHMAENFHIPFPFDALIGIAVAVAIGVVTAFSAVRVRGVSLAVVTLAGAVAIQNFGFYNPTWGGGTTGSGVPELTLFGLDLGTNAGFRGIDGDVPSPVFGWVALACCVLLCVMVGFIRRGTLGRRMLAVRSNERAASAAAINPRTVKLWAFTIAAFIAGAPSRRCSASTSPQPASTLPRARNSASPSAAWPTTASRCCSSSTTWGSSSASATGWWCSSSARSSPTGRRRSSARTPGSSPPTSATTGPPRP